MSSSTNGRDQLKSVILVLSQDNDDSCAIACLKACLSGMWRKRPSLAIKLAPCFCGWLWWPMATEAPGHRGERTEPERCAPPLVVGMTGPESMAPCVDAIGGGDGKGPCLFVSMVRQDKESNATTPGASS